MILQEEYYLRKNITDCLVHRWIPEGHTGYLLFKHKNLGSKLKWSFISIQHVRESSSPHYHRVSIVNPVKGNAFAKVVNKDGEEEFNRAFSDNYIDIIMQSARQLCDAGYQPIFDLQEVKIAAFEIFLFSYEKNIADMLPGRFIDEVCDMLISSKVEEKEKFTLSMSEMISMNEPLRQTYENSMKLANASLYFNWLQPCFTIA